MKILESENLFREKVFEYLNSEEEPKTFIGLAVFLGITKSQLLEIRSGECDTPEHNFSGVVKKADTLFEKYAESMLFNKNVSQSGIMFYLKSIYGWKEGEVKEKEEIKVNISVIEKEDNV